MNRVARVHRANCRIGGRHQKFALNLNWIGTEWHFPTPHAPATVLGPRPRVRRIRRALPPLNSRDWMTPGETAVTLGCSIATVHRMRRGLIAGLTPLPYSQYGRKVIFRKASTAQWIDENEKNRLT